MQGGKREGAGRKPKFKGEEESTTIAFRVPLSKKSEIEKKLNIILKQYADKSDMAQANELRLGNILQSEGRYYIVTQLSSDNYISVRPFNHNEAYTSGMELKPVPITAEILLRQGLKRSLGFIGNEYYAFKEGPEFLLYRNMANEGLRLECKIDTLHKFQNLHFILSGEELKVTL